MDVVFFADKDTSLSMSGSGHGHCRQLSGGGQAPDLKASGLSDCGRQPFYGLAGFTPPNLKGPPGAPPDY